MGINVGTLRAMVCRKRIPHIRISPRVVVFDIDELDRWLAERRVDVDAATTVTPTR
jgi:hypothetical protein